MSTQTPNLNLTKPAGNERPYRSVINDNMDILDSKIGAVGSTDLQSQVTSLGESVSKFIFVDVVKVRFAKYVDAGGDRFCIELFRPDNTYASINVAAYSSTNHIWLWDSSTQSVIWRL